MFDTNGSSVASESPVVTPEKILNSVSLSTEEVTIASTNAIEITAPVFCSIVRAPAAIPRRLVGTVPIIAAVLGLLNMPEPTPTTNSHSADQKYGVCTPSIVIPASATARDDHPRRRQRARAAPVGPDRPPAATRSASRSPSARARSRP